MAIVGIMATMDVLSQGYPFLEAVHSFLSWGDELMVVDGTWRIVGGFHRI